MHPLLVNRVVFPLIEWAKGKPTHARLRELERTQWLSPAALCELQLKRLRHHLDFAYREVPYYTRLFDQQGLRPTDVRSLEDLARLPVLTKELIRRHFDELTARKRIRRVTRMSSGGSTGSPVTVLVDMERMAFSDAPRLREIRWLGADMRVRELVLWGSSIELGRQDRIRTLRDRLINSRLLSAFDLGEEVLARYADVLRRNRPEKLFGYASALYLFARHLQRSGWKPEASWPRAVFTTAEPLYDFQRATIESVFGCPVSVEYGCRETGFMAAECPSGGLHIAAEGLVVEVLPNGELVVTHLDSHVMPMIRYSTGDVGTLDESPCACGRGLPRLRSVEGRRTDFLVTPGGRVLHALAVIYVLRECSGIREFQVTQEQLDRLTVTVVPDGTFPPSTRELIASRLTRLFEGQVAVDIELVESIAKPASGKHRYVISKVAAAYLDLPAPTEPPSKK